MEGDQRLGKSPEPRNISIHSLRMEGDNRRQQPQAKASHFNPLPPHGGRLDKITEQDYADLFQSTPSAWRETILTLGICAAACISIHSLRMEGDGHSQKNTPTFNISIHSLRMEGDYTSTEVKARYNDFNPLPPHGGRPKTDPKKHTYQQISIHSLRMEGDELRMEK